MLQMGASSSWIEVGSWRGLGARTESAENKNFPDRVGNDQRLSWRKEGVVRKEGGEERGGSLGTGASAQQPQLRHQALHCHTADHGATRRLGPSHCLWSHLLVTLESHASSNPDPVKCERGKAKGRK